MEGTLSYAQPDTTILITGATDGIGKATALALAARGHTVLIHGRNPDRCRRTVADIRDATGNFAVHAYTADFASLAEVRRLAFEVTRDHPRLDVLINNAGIGPVIGTDRSRRLSMDGYELRFAVNHLAHFLLTRLLLPILERSPHARTVLVASGAQTAIRFHDVMLEQRYDAFEAYAQSKLAMVMFAMELADRLRDSRVTANALHPGTLLDTKMVREGFGRPQGSPEEGADAIVYLATAADLEAVTGQYFDGKRLARAHPQAYDGAARRALWSLSERLVGIEPSPSAGEGEGSNSKHYSSSGQ